MTGSIDQVSLEIGTVKGQLESLQRVVAEGNESRKDLHEKVNTILQAQVEFSAKMQGFVGEFEKMAKTVKAHEELRQQGHGMKILIGSALSSGFLVGAVELVKNFKLKG